MSNTASEHLRLAIDRQQVRLRDGVPPDRHAAILALLRVGDRPPPIAGPTPIPDLVTGHRLASLGGNLALRFYLESTGDDALVATDASSERGADWAERFLQDCGELAAAELVLTHCQTGFMRLVEEIDETFAAWIATRRPPTSWRERADIDWWAAWLAKQHAPSWDGGDSGQAMDSRQLADRHLAMMAYQFGYPPDTTIGGCTIQTYRDVLGQLITRALHARDRGEPTSPQSEPALVGEIASALALDPEVIGRALAALTLDRDNAAYHAAVPGVAAAPLVRLEPEHLAWSLHGLTSEPGYFLTRELRRRDAEAYHNTAHRRESVFRQDLYALFADKRFVTSLGRIELRRDAGDVRTDIDAVVFDRKTGTLGVFELKSQDPYARSTAELTRQRDNVLYANRQVAGVLDWVNRHGADALLGRVDRRAAKTFRVQKVVPFVLGRFLAHFSDGQEPDRRAAWGTWPQVLRLTNGQPFKSADANPIVSLFTRLRSDGSLVHLPIADTHPPREIVLGPTRLVVYPSYAAFQGRGATTQAPGS